MSIEKPSMNAFTFFLPAILDLSLDFDVVIFLLSLALIGSSTQNPKLSLSMSRFENSLVLPITNVYNISVIFNLKNSANFCKK